MVGSRFDRVETRRPDLRFPLPDNFAERLQGALVECVDRRGKYLLLQLSTDETLIMHLGMSGRFTINSEKPDGFALGQSCNPAHDHVVFKMSGNSTATITYNDPRRFGFMDLADTDKVDFCKYFKEMGPEPLGNRFSIAVLDSALCGRQAPIKSVLLDQKTVAGLGNIYVCEALYRAGISPRRKAATVVGKRSARLHREITNVLRDAIKSGGSTLNDFASASGELGYFQHKFEVYDREGANCVKCGQEIQRITQSGRSTFFCSYCQR